MRLPSFQYLEPANVEEALSILRDRMETVRVLAGGTDLLNRMKWRLLEPAFLMNIASLQEMDGIHVGDSETVLGANTRLREVAGATAVQMRFTAVAEAAFQVASPAITNMATLGGNLLQNTRCMYYNQSGMVLQGLERCHKRGGTVCLAVKGGKRCFSVYQGDLAPALIAFHARCVLEKKGSARTVPLVELFSGNGASPFTIGDDELLTKVIVPHPGGIYGSAYRKLRLRGSTDYPLASAAAFVSVSNDQKITRCRLVIGAAGAAPKVLDGAPGDADGEDLARKASALAEGVDNLLMPGAYRRKVTGLLAKRAIRAAVDRARKGA